MYPLEWVEKWKLNGGSPWSGAARVRGVSPVVWSLGFTSLLTDVSTEMVNSILPAYLVLHLRLSPLQFAAIDGIYNGLSVALVAVLAGFFADRAGRRKEVAVLGYAVSAFSKLGLLLVGGAWGLISLMVGLDRLGKGIRTAPRDSMISLHTKPEMLGAAFGVHRALDAAGAFLGPLVAFALLALLPGAFDVLWVVSFVVGCLGVAALVLFVPKAQPVREVTTVSVPTPSRLRSPRFLQLGICGTVLAVLTVSDGFLYLMLQQKSQTSPGLFPLFYVGTAMAYMSFAIPAGLLADRYGRTRVFAVGYGLLITLYLVVFMSSKLGVPLVLGCLALLGLYYAATEGVLMALASAIVAERSRATGLAMLATSIGLGKLVSSIAFGWIWQAYGANAAIATFAVGGAIVLFAVTPRLKAVEHG